MQLRPADNDGEAIAEAQHDRRRHERDELVASRDPDHKHEATTDHDGWEKQLNALTVPARLRRSWDQCRNNSCESSLRPVDHPRASAEEAADQPHNPSGVYSNRWLDVRHEGKGNRLRDLGEADGDSECHLRLDKGRLLRRRHLPPALDVKEFLHGGRAGQPLHPVLVQLWLGTCLHRPGLCLLRDRRVRRDGRHLHLSDVDKWSRWA
mmetsp:Transcript_35125/g.110380  ORF Transcript_35125/g.110380 Transcript_35125/m.110380 type:complete len:208 (-) Transcript_35125:31-654(-)